VKRITSLIVPAILLGMLIAGSLIIMLFAGSPADKKETRVVAVMKTIDSNMEFWEVVKTGMREAAKEFGVRLEIVGPWAESDVAGQIEVMESVLRDPPAAIILSATDYKALVPSVEKAKAAKIPIVTMDSGVDSDIPESFVATNNIEAGEKAGREMMRLLEPGRTIAVVSHIRGATTAMEREQGVAAALAADGRYPGLGTRYSNNYEENAYAITLELLDAHPDLGGILAMNEVSTIGVAKAIKDKKLGRKVRLVGFDNSLVEIKLIEEGIIDATVIQKPFNMGYLSVRTAREVVDGGKPAAFIDTESVLVTVDTLYSPENQKLLFPFSVK
jgi:ribose transport system substrate-binding protein